LQAASIQIRADFSAPQLLITVIMLTDAIVYKLHMYLSRKKIKNRREILAIYNIKSKLN
jgi:hypothetical protein